MSEPTEMELVVGLDGGVRCIYDESLDLRALGKLQITRASHVEPDSDGNWFADMGPSGGPVLGPFQTRGQALHGEEVVGGSGRVGHQQSATTVYRPRHLGLSRGRGSQSLQKRVCVPMTVNVIKQVFPARCFDL